MRTEPRSETTSLTLDVLQRTTYTMEYRLAKLERGKDLYAMPIKELVSRTCTTLCSGTCTLLGIAAFVGLLFLTDAYNKGNLDVGDFQDWVLAAVIIAMMVSFAWIVGCSYLFLKSFC